MNTFHTTWGLFQRISVEPTREGKMKGEQVS
jgi:hypothetical protein